jgi:transposase-like protein
MREEILRFRQEEYRKHPRRPRNIIRYPPSLQRRVVAYSRRGRSAGRSLWRIAGELGLGQGTLRNWMARHPKPRFLRVAVKGPAPTPAPSEKAASPMVLVTPRGYRVEGLDRASLTELLRSLA